MSVRVELGTDTILNYKRLSYTHWHALAEFVDNSTQSYFNNRAALDASFKTKGERLEVRIMYDKGAGILRISDNGAGMNEEELDRAVKIGRPPANPNGRCEYGLGMKTAACWLGDTWEVRTKRLGSPTELCVTFDVPSVASGKLDLDVTNTPKKEELHYTIVTISKLHAKLAGRTIGKIKRFLQSMYRVDTRDRKLALWWDSDDLTWSDDTLYLKNTKGELYRKEFKFDVNGKSVSGTVGILGEGSSGRPNAGFSLFRYGRVIRGHPDAWRPEEIFGQFQGSNDLINQRITGEIHLDPKFLVSHTKDDILWQGDEEDIVEKELRRLCEAFIEVAKTPRKAGAMDTRGPSSTEVAIAVDELKTEMASHEFADTVNITEVPPPAVIQQAVQPIIDAAMEATPTFSVKIGDMVCDVLLSEQDSPNDPYYVNESSKDSVLVVVNRRHPHWTQLAGSESVLNFLRHCVYDAVAEWQCVQKHASLEPTTIKMLKDSLLRVPAEMEASAAGRAT